MTISAAFADERNVRYAMGLIAQSPEIKARFSRRSVIGERGEVQLVILEVTINDPRQAGRVETCLEGAHGVRIAPQADAAQLVHTA
jgi:hypothetical protein